MQNDIDRAGLVDLRDVYIDLEQPRQERIADYIRQVRDPYHVKCGKYVLEFRFAEDGPPMEDCLRLLMT
jgi:hypothetical protein